MAVLSHAAIQYGHGAGQNRSHLARRYAELVPDKALARTVFASLEEEMAAHAKRLRRSPARRQRLADNPALAASLSPASPIFRR